MPHLPPWNAGPSTPPAFVVLWTTGSDPALDGLFRVLALRPDGEGWRAFDAWSLPFEVEQASARMAREFGVHASDLEGARAPEAVWADLEGFLGGAPVVSPDAASYAAWSEALGGSSRVAIGLAEVAALLLPGRLAHRREGLVRALVAEHEGPPAAVFPSELVQALAEVCRRGLGRDRRVQALAALGYERAHQGLLAIDPAAAERLAFALTIVERPDRWAKSTGELFHPGEDLPLRAFEDSIALDPHPDLLDELHPAAQRSFGPWERAPEMPPDTSGRAPFAVEDRALLERVFELHLPDAMVADGGGERADYLRPAQVRVAREVADTLGADELLLVHAPTGTGKTLAYLVPALLWAHRYGVRVGIATYTRALQEQAMDAEVPRALAALSRAGVPGPLRVSLLKGRENYLCYRALRTMVPDEDEDAEGWLAWTQLVLFALTDHEGDLDRFSRQPPVRLTSPEHYRSRLQQALKGVRARTGCCTHVEDRSTCAAELARRRAERSHVVITNQSFVLARREFFQHLIFDECEHLHDVAAAVWSHSIAPWRLREQLRRLSSPGRRTTRAPLDRLQAQLLPATFAGQEADLAVERCREAERLISDLELQARAFDEWRHKERRGEDEQYRLFGEYLDTEEGQALVRANLSLCRALGALEGSIGRVLEASEALPLRGGPRLRRTLVLARGELSDAMNELGSWIPTQAGQPRLLGSIFHDVEVDERGELLLRASVLLPGEVLGRQVHPELSSAVYLSATTKIGGGFDAARAYLGLDRAAEPFDDEEREGRVVRCAEAPEAFDYSRVLVCAPRDVPEPRNKLGHLAYVERFIEWLGTRTRGRILVLFTNQADVRQVGANLAPHFRAKRIPLWYQGMPEMNKEELTSLFRDRVDSILLGVDTFWFGADFPGETLEYVVLVRLPYGVPDRYHHAQKAVLGAAAHRQKIYLPRALAKFRQGFGRLMRRPTDKGVVFVLDRRFTDPRHRPFLRELPLAAAFEEEGAARLVRGDSTQVLRQALAHMGMLADLERRGLSPDFTPAARAVTRAPAGLDEPPVPPPKLEISIEDLPF